MSPKLHFLLFLIITLEGYVVLSSELLAIRLTIPFVGSGTDTVSVIIAAVLMPLAFGYQAGGRFKPGIQKLYPWEFKREERQYVSVRDKLVANLIISLCFLFFGLSYSFLHPTITGLQHAGLNDRVIITALYAALFIAPPTYFLGQTIPLTCNFFSSTHLPKITGSILFFSTLGSFAGAVFSTLILMPYIGAHYTAALNFVILTALIAILSRSIFTLQFGFVLAMMIAGVLNNSWPAMKQLFIVENNQYNVIAVYETDDLRELVINNNLSSRYTAQGRKHVYIEFMEEQIIWRAPPERMPMDILVIGAGAFTFGANDKENNFVFVDIDKDLKHVAEERILKRALHENVTFHALPARGYLQKTDKQFDAIILDAYSGRLTAPEHLITREFFQSVKDHLKPDGIMISNSIASANFSGDYSRNLDNTIRSVFPHVARHTIGQAYDWWDDTEERFQNVIYMYKNHQDSNEDTKTIYSDTKNRVFIDLP